MLHRPDGGVVRQSHQTRGDEPSVVKTTAAECGHVWTDWARQAALFHDRQRVTGKRQCIIVLTGIT